MTDSNGAEDQTAGSWSGARLPPRTVATNLGLFWLIFLVLYTIRSLIIGGPHQFSAFSRRVAVAVVGIALAWLMYRILHWSRPATLRRGIILAAGLSVPAALLYAFTNFMVFDVIAPMPGDVAFPGGDTNMRQFISGLSELTIQWSFVFAAWGLLYLTLAAAAKTREADQRANAHLQAARLAEIRALRYQVNPHFLFNLLNALSTLVGRKDTVEAETLIGEMGRFFRFSLATDPVADVALVDEVDMQVQYLELERRRFPNRLTILVDIDAAAAGAAVPSLILQPLVENAIKHGVGCCNGLVAIRLGASLTGDGRLTVSIEDNASGTQSNAPVGTGTGLKNVADRLAARFGADAVCHAGPGTHGGYCVTLTIPFVSVRQ